MKLPNSSFPNSIPVELYKAYAGEKKPVSIATLMVPATEVSDKQVCYTLQEKRFTIEVRVRMDRYGDAARITPDDVVFARNLGAPGAREVMVIPTRVVKEFNTPVHAMFL